MGKIETKISLYIKSNRIEIRRNEWISIYELWRIWSRKVNGFQLSIECTVKSIINYKISP